MEVTVISLFTGKPVTKDLDVTREQLDRWYNGEHIQIVFPRLTTDDREFLISGAMGTEFEDMFPED